jgi:RNA polymerase sigma factor (sigma-70 family)
LAQWIGQRDEAAFADLVARHGPMVLGLCRRVLGDVQHAEDVFQATFLVLARKAANLRRPEALPGYLYGVALRLARKSREAARRELVQASLGTREPADPHPDPLDVLSGRELLTLLDDEVARLPEVYRLALLLCVMQGRPVEEAARLLGWSVGSVRGRLARGRERLRNQLSRRGLDLSAGVLALLVPATVSERLMAEVMRNLAAPASAVSALAGSASVLKLKGIGLGLFLAVASLGAGLALLRAPEPETPAPVAPAALPVQAKDETRRDRYGDPLPPGAVARLGTLRFRAASWIEALAFAPDGKKIAVSSRAGLILLDAATGKRIRVLPTSNPEHIHESLLAFSPDKKRLIGKAQDPGGFQIRPVVRVWDLTSERKPQEYAAERVIWLGWSVDGEPLAVCLEQGALRLRELAARRSRRFEGKDLPRPDRYPELLCVCTIGGQTLAVTRKGQRLVYVWDIATGRQRFTLQPKGDHILGLAVSPDGSKLVSGTHETLQAWDLGTGRTLYTVDSTDNYCSPVFSADGKTLAVPDSWSSIRFLDAATGRARVRTQGKYYYAPCFAFSPDGKEFVTAQHESSALNFWTVATGERTPEPARHSNRPHGTAFSPDGRRVATGGGLDGTIHVWDLATSESLVRIQRSPKWVRDYAFSADGRSLFSTWTDENLWVSDAATGKLQQVIKLEDPDRPDTYQSAISMHISDDDERLVAFSYYYGKKQAGLRYEDTLITGWDPSTRRQLFRRRLPGTGSRIALSADGRALAVLYPYMGDRGLEEAALRGAPVKQWIQLEDVATGEPLLTFPTLGGQVWPLVFSPDGRLLAVNNFDYTRRGKKDDPAGATGNALHLWETATAAEVLTLPLESQHRTAFSPDGRLLALSAPSQTILVWDLRGGRELRRFKGFDAEVTSLAFSPDGRRLISGLTDSTLLVWDVGPKGTAAPSKLGAEGVAKAWADLAGADAARAFRARWALVAAPEEALPLLKEHLRPVPAADAQRLRRLLTDLDSDQYALRQQAQLELEEIGELAEPALRQTLANKPTLEVRRRVQAVLKHLSGPVARPELRRSLRALAVLEDIATPPARRLLEDVAGGAPEARLTREAKASLCRLERRMPASR